MEKINNTQSSLHISEGVVETIIREAVKEINGVVALANLPARFSVFSTQPAQAVNVSINADVAELDVGIVVNLDCRVKEVCENVQQAVKDAVQNMTGITVAKVNVRVAGVESLKTEK